MPRILPCCLPLPRPGRRFNEAGAFCPGYWLPRPNDHASPFLASMRPGHFAPDIGRRPGRRAGRARASMRPGHFAPDMTPKSGPRSTTRRFNEAGAFCPGYCRRPAADVRVVRAASMRPGHFAPDIRRRTARAVRRMRSFNEAGAFCPGYLTNFTNGHGTIDASMRPGHFAPDMRRPGGRLVARPVLQ